MEGLFIFAHLLIFVHVRKNLRDTIDWERIMHPIKTDHRESIQNTCGRETGKEADK